MGRSVSDERKTEYLKFRVTESFKQTILDLKNETTGCRNMDLQQYIVRLIEIGMEEEQKTNYELKQYEMMAAEQSTEYKALKDKIRKELLEEQQGDNSQGGSRRAQ